MGTSAELPLLYPYLALAFTLLATVFSRRRLAARSDEFKATLLYFAFFFLLLFALPVLAVLLTDRNSLDFLGRVGLRVGNWRLGLGLAAAAVPLALAGALVSGRDPLMRDYYPFSKAACLSPKRLALYETSYFFLYYWPWEFAFRGVLFFPLVGALGLVPALAVQTLLSTLYHIGHPDTEIAAALAAGFLFGLIAYFTRSILYTAAIHALFGLTTDVAFCLRYHRRKS
ncbi:MAG: CPBP family intramembrane glutamic endopeptidase [Candidatus Aminicenantales bacterium]